METPIRFAFAVNLDEKFGNEHFGDANKYLIYDMTPDNIKFMFEKENVFKVNEDDHSHGKPQKGKAISQFLIDLKVKVLVSRQFGPNIRIINQHFVPVLISNESPEEAGEILHRYFTWINDELILKNSDYKLFTITQGILKSSIKDKG